MESALALSHRSPELLVGTYRQVCVAVWNTQPTRALFEIQRDALTLEVKKRPGEQLFLCVVSASADPPSAEIRQASASMITRHGRNLLGCACVIEGEGFRAAATRTVLTGISLVVRTPSPYKFFESTVVACEWLGRRTKGENLMQLADELARARAKVSRGR